MFRALLAHRAPRGGERHPGSLGVIQVQDLRLEQLAARFGRDKATPVEIRLHDLCTSLESSFPTPELEGMKRMDLLLGVLPAYADPSPAASVAALERLLAELALEDLAAVERRLARHPREKLEAIEKQALEIAAAALEAECPVRLAKLSDPQRSALRGYALITERPLIALRNLGESNLGAAIPAELVARAAELGAIVLSLCAPLEAELAELAPEERADFLAEYGVREPAGAAVTRAILEQSEIVSFFTVSEEECRAWPIARGTPAQQAAGKVHSDMERGFIRAEVIGFEELMDLEGLWNEARKRGILRVEGKDYEIRDGEVVHFRFNV